MTELALVRSGDFLVPLDQQSHDIIQKLKPGVGLTVKFKLLNNPKFHRKLFKLFNLAFEAWEPGQHEYKGEKVSKEFNQFRNDVTVLAGFYEASVNLRNEVRLKAKSINFDSMEQDEREKLYSAVLDVTLQKILTQYTKDDIENVLNQVIGFA